MENFSIRLRRTELQQDGRLYMEFEPQNMELVDKVTHGHTGLISGGITATIAAYTPVAAGEMLEAIERMYPGVYALDAQYGE